MTSAADNRNKLQMHRIKMAFVPILSVYLLLMIRLAYIQGVLGTDLRKTAIDGRSTTITAPARRGSIFDRNGRALAVSVYSGVLWFDPTVFVLETDKKQAIHNEAKLKVSEAAVAADLNMPIDEVIALVGKYRAAVKPDCKKHQFCLVRKGLPFEVAKLLRRDEDKLIGFALIDGTKRVLPCGQAVAQVVGFVNSRNLPQAGIEKSCQSYLVGTEGVVRAQVDRYRRVFPETVAVKVEGHDGANIYTSIEPYAQTVAMEEAQKIYEAYHPKGVSIVVTDPSTGDILAMVSMPTIDPDPDDRKKIPLESDMKDCLVERCASFVYEPGSTLKALTIASALDTGAITMDTVFRCSGVLHIGNKSIHCPVYGPWDAHGHGGVNAREILKHSCNVGAAQVGLTMGPESLYAADRRFGIFESLQIDLPSSTIGWLSLDRHERINSKAKVARVAFGHSVATTPLHVAMAYSAIANGGKLMRPRLVTQIKDSHGKLLKSNEPTIVRQVISQRTSEEMTDMLCDVVEKGTGKTAAIKGYRVAGKTGTAKKYQPGKYAASFIGYLPASPQAKPRVVILVVVDEPQSGPHYGAQVAAPAFHEIASKLMSYWKVPEDDPNNLQQTAATAGMRHDHDAPHSAGHQAAL